MGEINSVICLLKIHLQISPYRMQETIELLPDSH